MLYYVLSVEAATILAIVLAAPGFRLGRFAAGGVARREQAACEARS
jgi:hypothetical protein